MEHANDLLHVNCVGQTKEPLPRVVQTAILTPSQGTVRLEASIPLPGKVVAITTQAAAPALLPTWALWGACAAAALLATLAWAHGWVYHRRRRGAWPHHLARLEAGPPQWPAFRAFVGIMATYVLVSAALNAGTWLSSLAAMVAGVACLIVASRRWGRGLATLGMGLLTAGVVLVLPAALCPHRVFPSLYLLATGMVGLGLMSGFWHWLGDVWEQQLLDGRPWTTAGAMIPNARIVGQLSAIAGSAIGLWVLVEALVGNRHSGSVGHGTDLWLMTSAGYMLVAAAAWWSGRRRERRWLRGLAGLVLVTFGALVAVWVRGR